jgi:hypothetical protein
VRAAQEVRETRSAAWRARACGTAPSHHARARRRSARRESPRPAGSRGRAGSRRPSRRGSRTPRATRAAPRPSSRSHPARRPGSAVRPGRGRGRSACSAPPRGAAPARGRQGDREAEARAHGRVDVVGDWAPRPRAVRPPGLSARPPRVRARRTLREWGRLDANDGNTYIFCSDFTSLSVNLVAGLPYKMTSNTSTAPGSCLGGRPRRGRRRAGRSSRAGRAIPTSTRRRTAAIAAVDWWTPTASTQRRKAATSVRMSVPAPTNSAATSTRPTTRSACNGVRARRYALQRGVPPPAHRGRRADRTASQGDPVLAIGGEARAFALDPGWHAAPRAAYSARMPSSGVADCDSFTGSNEQIAVVAVRAVRTQP